MDKEQALREQIETIASRITQLRKQCLNYSSRKDFAELVSIPEHTLKKYESGEIVSIPVEALIKIKNALEENYFCSGDLWRYLLGEAPCEDFKYISINDRQIKLYDLIPPKTNPLLKINLKKLLENEAFCAYWNKNSNESIQDIGSLKSRVTILKERFIKAATDFAESDYFAYAVCCQLNPDKAKRITENGKTKYKVQYD